MITPEPQWITQAKKGNSEAFSRLVEIYQTPVYNLCYRMLGDPYEAEDAAQEAFLRAYHAMRQYDERRSFTTWLLSIAAHYCIDQIRRRRLQLFSLDEAEYLEPPDAAPGPEQSYSINEVQRKVQALLNHLSPQDRAAVVMYYWYDFSYDEIAGALSLTVSAVKSRLHRARLALAQEWTDRETQAQAAERKQNDKAHSPAF